jgi:hypothetical protein
MTSTATKRSRIAAERGETFQTGPFTPEPRGPEFAGWRLGSRFMEWTGPVHRMPDAGSSGGPNTFIART